MRVLHVVTLASAAGRYGGPFDVVREQVALLDSAGADVELVAGWTLGDRGPELDAGRSSYRRVHRWMPTKDFTALMSWAMLRQLWVSVGRADVVHVSLVREAIPVAAVLIAVLRGRPVVAQPHGMLTSRYSRLHSAVDRLIRPLLDRVSHWLVLTAVEERELRARFGGVLRTTTVIGNPVPFDQEEGRRLRAAAPPPAGTAVFVARLHPRKRVLDFAAAAAVASSRGWHDRYRVVGPDQGDLAALQQRAGELPNLTYDGTVPGDAVPALLTRSGVFVLTSRAEPWGNVLASAVALGVPTVLTRSSALAEVLDGRPGVRLVDDGDAEAVASAVHDSLLGGHVEPSDLFDRATVQRTLMGVYRSVVRGGEAL